MLRCIKKPRFVRQVVTLWPLVLGFFHWRIEMKKANIVVAVFLFALLVVFRLIPHPAGFSPLWAVAIFCGSYWRASKFRFVIPVAATVLTDFYLGLYPGAIVNYMAIVLAVLVAPALLASLWRVAVSGALAALIFFAVSNLGVWWASDMYAQNFAGLMDCYVMGLPFLRTSLESTVVFSGLLYGLYRLVLAPVGWTGFLKLDYGRHQR